MLSRRENLLVRPWQQRKYENHRRKIQSAMPIIDNQPPPTRRHVEVKMKHLQKEKERCQKIENDNLILLKRLNYIMKTNRVDNNWTVPQPNFLSRIKMYPNKVKHEEVVFEEKEIYSDQNLLETCKRRLRCSACTPHKKVSPKIPEERIPWEPVKLPASKERSKSVPVRKPHPLPRIQEKSIPVETPTKRPVAKDKKSEMKKTVYTPKKIDLNFRNVKSPHNITIKRGALRLAINFPSDAFVRLQSGPKEKRIMGDLCYCKRFTPNALMCQ